MKTNKSFQKRLRVTKNGKILSRRPGQNHFNAKESRHQQMANRRPQLLHLSAKAVSRFITPQ